MHVRETLQHSNNLRGSWPRIVTACQLYWNIVETNGAILLTIIAEWNLGNLSSTTTCLKLIVQLWHSWITKPLDFDILCLVILYFNMRCVPVLMRYFAWNLRLFVIQYSRWRCCIAKHVFYRLTSEQEARLRRIWNVNLSNDDAGPRSIEIPSEMTTTAAFLTRSKSHKRSS